MHRSGLSPHGTGFSARLDDAGVVTQAVQHHQPERGDRTPQAVPPVRRPAGLPLSQIHSRAVPSTLAVAHGPARLELGDDLLLGLPEAQVTVLSLRRRTLLKLARVSASTV